MAGKMKMSLSASPMSNSRKLLVLKLTKPNWDVVFLLGLLLYLVSSEAQFVQTTMYEFLVVEYYNFEGTLRGSTSKQEVFAVSWLRP